MAGSLALRDHPDNIVRLVCEKCGRQGRYYKATLIERFGSNIALPDLRHEIARCGRQHRLGDACAVHYVGLAVS